MNRRSVSRRAGITLLEVVLALALVAIAMTLLAQLVGIGNRAAATARDSANAQLFCESLMSELLVGVLPLESTSETALPTDPNWLYSVDVVVSPSGTMNIVTVNVRRGTTSRGAVSFSLTQWIMIPLEESTDTDIEGAA